MLLALQILVPLGILVDFVLAWRKGLLTVSRGVLLLGLSLAIASTMVDGIVGDRIGNVARFVIILWFVAGFTKRWGKKVSGHESKNLKNLR